MLNRWFRTSSPPEVKGGSAGSTAPGGGFTQKAGQFQAPLLLLRTSALLAECRTFSSCTGRTRLSNVNLGENGISPIQYNLIHSGLL